MKYDMHGFDLWGYLTKRRNDIYNMEMCSEQRYRYDEICILQRLVEQHVKEQQEIKAKSKTVPHVHAEVIKAWADGNAIEYYSEEDKNWFPIKYPAFVEEVQYRIKASKKSYGDILRNLLYPKAVNYPSDPAYDKIAEEFMKAIKEMDSKNN